MQWDAEDSYQSLETVTGSSGHSQRELARYLRVPAITVLAHPDPHRVGERAMLRALHSGKSSRLSRLKPKLSAPGHRMQRPLADPHLSRQPILILPVAAEDASQGVRLVASETRTRLAVDGQVVEQQVDLGPERLERGVVLLLANRIVVLLHFLPAMIPELPRYGLVGESAGIAAVRQQIAQVADLDAPVLIRGETGTGKELVANAIHQASPRRGPFVAVNMGAVPTALAAAELFGAAKGAYTGADRQREGYFIRARQGTLFLDEIGETPAEVQAMLLRTLETRVVQPVGAEKSVEVNARILAATDAHLEAEIEAGRFRAPLLHRLSGYEIHLPALRERRDDIARLLIHFLRLELETLGERWRLDEHIAPRPWLPAALVARLVSYAWPGNVRQLRNVARQLVISNRGAAVLEITPPIEALLSGEPGGGNPPGGPASAHAGGDLGMGDGALEAHSREDPRHKDPDPKDRDPMDPHSEDTAGLPTDRFAKSPEPAKAKKPGYRPPDAVDEEEILAALRAHQFRIQPAAAALGISRTSLYARIERSEKIRKARDLTLKEIEHSRMAYGGDLDAMAADLEVSRKGLRRRMTQLGLD